MTVAVVGAGGGGSLLVEMLAHLGVGRIVVIDYDVVDETNLSRIVGATPADVGRLKVDVAHDLAARIDPDVVVDAVYGDIAYVDDARRLLDADFAFLATDNILSRYAFNLVCHQFLIPGIQVGAKVTGDAAGGVELVHVMERPLTLSGACLDCTGVIPPDALTRRAALDRGAPRAGLRRRRRRCRHRRAVGDHVELDLDLAGRDRLPADGDRAARCQRRPRAAGLLPVGARAARPSRRGVKARLPLLRRDSVGERLARGDLKGLSLKPGARPPRAFEPATAAVLPTRVGVLSRARAFVTEVLRRHD